MLLLGREETLGFDPDSRLVALDRVVLGLSCNWRWYLWQVTGVDRFIVLDLTHLRGDALEVF